MISYSANKQGNKLVNITKIMVQMTVTDTAGEYNLNATGEYFYFAENTDKALYEAIRQSSGGVIVKRKDDEAVINSFSQAISLNQTEATIISAEVQNEAQETVKEIVHETVYNQPIVQPVVIQQGESLQPQFQTYTADPILDEEITFAEIWVRDNIKIPLNNIGVTTYWYEAPPPNIPRPREYVVLTPDEEMRDIDYSNDKGQRQESRFNAIVQGNGNTMDNWVLEIAQRIERILSDNLGKCNNITHREIGLDMTTNIYTRIVSCWIRNK